MSGDVAAPPLTPARPCSGVGLAARKIPAFFGAEPAFVCPVCAAGFSAEIVPPHATMLTAGSVTLL